MIERNTKIDQEMRACNETEIDVQVSKAERVKKVEKETAVGENKFMYSDGNNGVTSNKRCYFFQ